MAKKTIALEGSELEKVIRQLVIDKTYYISGSNSIYVPELNTRYINEDTAREWPDIDGEVVLMTPGEAARTELKRLYPDLNNRVRKSEFKLLDISQPMYFKGERYTGELYYYDIVAAYPSIYRWLTADCVWPRGEGQYPLFQIADRLWPWKAARSSLVGISRSHEMLGCKGKTCKWVSYHNPLFNPALWHTVLQILHDIAAYAIGNGAIYISTDCGIFTRERDYRRVVSRLEETFELHKLQGDGRIDGWGNYSLPGKKTRATNESRTAIFNVQGEKGETYRWLKKIISYKTL